MHMQFSRATTSCFPPCDMLCLKAWVAARQAKDFSKFAPVLQEWVDLIKERSKYIDSGKPCYDVALQDFEKGMSTARLDEIFCEVGSDLQQHFCFGFSPLLFVLLQHLTSEPMPYSLGECCLPSKSIPKYSNSQASCKSSRPCPSLTLIYKHISLSKQVLKVKKM